MDVDCIELLRKLADGCEVETCIRLAFGFSPQVPLVILVPFPNSIVLLHLPKSQLTIKMNPEAILPSSDSRNSNGKNTIQNTFYGFHFVAMFKICLLFDVCVS